MPHVCADLRERRPRRCAVPTARTLRGQCRLDGRLTVCSGDHDGREWSRLVAQRVDLCCLLPVHNEHACSPAGTCVSQLLDEGRAASAPHHNDAALHAPGREGQGAVGVGWVVGQGAAPASGLRVHRRIALGAERLSVPKVDFHEANVAGLVAPDALHGNHAAGHRVKALLDDASHAAPQDLMEKHVALPLPLGLCSSPSREVERAGGG
mmetsp:Transcript_88248/g.279166  ORF Transcript_88248/g.279166 Transcript_88248/m.279166 type:complete len:209 (+) Transcript_88248:739-1365(+)